ncbi:hypothetical protein SOPP22_12160 [Shewanella sp. OPT22]|nr:hypothetical protein SOPP22_12160 [Shewanella sp. OPT22]
MNFHDMGYGLVKKIKNQQPTYFRVVSSNEEQVILEDLRSGATLKLLPENLNNFVKDGGLKPIPYEEFPKTLRLRINDLTISSKRAKYCRFTPKLSSLEKKKEEKKSEYQQEGERRYAYVLGVYEGEIKAYTEKWLAPYLKMKADELQDDKPPAWRTLVRWVSIYEKSNYSKSSLIPRKEKSGNRTSRLPSELLHLIDEITDKYSYTSYKTLAGVYRELKQNVEALNDDRAKSGLSPIKVCSYRVFQTRFR